MTSPQQPTIGRIVHYTLGSGDVEQIDLESPQQDGNGRYLRNPVAEGIVLPAKVTAVFGPSCANLVVQLDGWGTFWATSRTEGDEPGQWFWPPRV